MKHHWSARRRAQAAGVLLGAGSTVCLTVWPGTVLAATDTATWDSSASSWSVTAHWAHSNGAAAGQVPNNGNAGLTYDVIINGGTVTQDILSGGGVTIDGLSFNGGILNGTGTLSLSAASTWSAGQISGTNTINFNNGGTFNGTTKTWISATFTLPANKSIQWTAGFINTGQGGGFQNAGSFVIGFDGSLSYNFGGAVPVLNNTGDVVKSAGTGTALIGMVMNNSNFVDSFSGTLSMNGGGNSSGSFNAGAGAAIEFSGGSANLTAASHVLGTGTVAFSGGATSINGSYSPGNTVVSGGTAQFNASATTTTLTITSGQLAGTGTLTASGAFSMTQGGFYDAGTTVLNGSGSISSASSKQFLGGHHVVVGPAATINWVGGNFDSGLGAVMINNGTFTTNFDGLFNYNFGGAVPTINNAGVLSKTAGTGTQSFLNVTLNNTGTVTTTGGTLSFDQGGASSGTFAAGASGQIDFSGGVTQTLSAGSSVSGAGTVSFGLNGGAGTTAINGAYATGATASYGAYGQFNALNSTTGSLTIAGSGGIAGTGTLTASGAFNMTQGGFYDAGTTVLNGSGSISGAGFKQLLGGHHVVIGPAATISWQGGNFDSGQGAGLINNGVLTTNFDGLLNYNFGGAIPAITNTGVLSKTGGTGTQTFFNASLNNSGTVSVTSGTISFNQGGASSGTFVAGASGQIDFSGSATQTLSAGSSVSGAGTVSFGLNGGAGSTAINGGYNTGATTAIGAYGQFNSAGATTGSLTIAGNGGIGGTGTLTASGPLNFTQGGFYDSGTTILNGSGSISSTGFKQLLGGHHLVIGSTGSINWAGGNFDSGLGAFLINNGNLVNNFDGLISYNFGGAVPTINNTGTFSKTAGTGTQTFLNASLNNSGTVSATNGTISFNQGGASSGTFIAGANGQIDFSGSAVQTIGASSSVSGTGTVSFGLNGGAGSTAFNGSYNVSSTVSIGAFGQFNGATATTGSLTIAGNGGIGGTGTLTVTGPLNFTQGGFYDSGTTILNGSGSISTSSFKQLLGGHHLVIGPASTISWLGGDFSSGLGAVIVNNGTLTTNFDGNWNYNFGGTIPTFNNNGLFSKTAGGGTTSTLLNAVINNAGTINLSGGTLLLGQGGASSGTFVAAAGTRMVFGGGTQTTGAASNFSGAGTVNVNVGAALIVGGSYNVGTTAITGGLLKLASGTNRVLRTNVLQFGGSTNSWSGQLDLADGDAIIDYTGATPYADVKNQIKTAYDNGAWNVGGIATSLGDAAHGLGYADNATLGRATFSGFAVDATSILVKYTYYGDANLDGQVDVTDLGALATNWQTAGDWTKGDFNYDGFVDVSDLGRLATNWQAGVGNPLGPGSFDAALAAVGLGGASVPEPATMSLATVALLSLSGFRRRRGNGQFAIN